MKKMLIALDAGPSSFKAVEYVAQQFGEARELQIGLVHILPNLPAIFWDEGHILSGDEKQERQKIVDKWIAERKSTMEPVFKQATAILTASGVKSQNIQSTSVSDSTDIADSIIEAARDGGYQTIVAGRCERSSKHILGGVASKIVSQARGMVVTIVE
jgi:nucleotide-binding universal stress UspA family protein